MRNQLRASAFVLSPLTAAVTAALFAGQLAAQTPAAVPPAQKIEKIEVTGSNIKRVDAETASSIQIITKAEIERSGVNTVAELRRIAAGF
jgi:iron complex outermembrane recepter protein